MSLGDLHVTIVNRRSSARRAVPLRAATGLVVAALVACGCSGGTKQKSDDEPSPSATESSSSSPSATESSAEPGAAGRFDLNAAVTLTKNPVFRAFTTTDHLLTLDRDGVTSRALPDLVTEYVIVPPTGGSPMDAWVDRTDGRGYLVSRSVIGGQGTAVGRDAFVVSRFGLDTGEVDTRARAAVRGSSANAGSTAVARIRGVVRDVVVLDTWVTVGEVRVHTGLGIDLARQEIAWRHPGEVLAVTPRLAVVSTGSTAEPGSVLGLDLETGRTTWSTLDGTVTANLVGVDDRKVVVARTGPFLSTTINTVSLRTGNADAGRTVDTSSYLCRPATPSVSVCILPERRVVAWGLARNRESWSLPTKSRYAPIVTLVDRGVVYGMIRDRWVALDARTGKDLDSGVGGIPIAAGPYGGLFSTDFGVVWLPDADHLPSASASPGGTGSASGSASDSPPGGESSSAGESPSG